MQEKPPAFYNNQSGGWNCNGSENNTDQPFDEGQMPPHRYCFVGCSWIVSSFKLFFKKSYCGVEVCEFVYSQECLLERAVNAIGQKDTHLDDSHKNF